MLTEFNPETIKALLTVSLFASLADGDMADCERENLRKLATDLGGESEALIREVLLGKRNLASAESVLTTKNETLLAYELALAVCEADGIINPREQSFLNDLRERLGLKQVEAQAASSEVDAIVLSDPSVGVSLIETGSNDDTIMRYAILNGALEILPSTLATMAIVPLQMKLVHAVAKVHGVSLGTTNIKDFLATIGAGLASQVVEGFARKLLGGIGKAVGGKLIGGLASQATGSAISFASTYAIGHVANRYYAGGQKLALPEIQALMGELTQKAKNLYTSKLPEIQSASKNLNPSAILDLVKGSVKDS